ncbi:MAG TPA: hypothetical protein VG015_00845 [Candidatus Dormibacteraeota bacterium]|nr:hypothetical protein [Candidatus Dormibacteraeota bacterium]
MNTHRVTLAAVGMAFLFLLLAAAWLGHGYGPRSLLGAALTSPATLNQSAGATPAFTPLDSPTPTPLSTQSAAALPTPPRNAPPEAGGAGTGFVIVSTSWQCETGTTPPHCLAQATFENMGPGTSGPTVTFATTKVTGGTSEGTSCRTSLTSTPIGSTVDGACDMGADGLAWYADAAAQGSSIPLPVVTVSK